MKRILIMRPFLATYRIGLYNRFTKDFQVKALLYGSKREKSALGFDVQRIIDMALFPYIQQDTGLYLGRHLVSSIYYRVIRQFHPDIILGHELGINTIVAILLRRLFNYRIFITVDDNPQMAQHEYSSKRAMLRRFVINHIDGYICVHPGTRDYLQQLFPDVRCKFLYFPIIQDDSQLLPAITNAAQRATEYIETYHLKEKIVLLYVGRFEAEKRIDLVLQAYAACRTKQTRLVLVGGGSLEGSMHTLAKSLHLGEDDVIFTGQLTGNDLYAWYYLAHIFVLACNHEAFGAVINESLVAGCRNIVPDNCGASNLITDENGSLFHVDNLDSLCQMMKQEIDATPLDKQHKSLMPATFEEYYQTIHDAINN